MYFMNLVIIERWHKLKRNYARVGRLFFPPARLLESPRKAIYNTVKPKVIYCSYNMIKTTWVIFYVQKYFVFSPWASWWTDSVPSSAVSVFEFVKVCCVASGAASSPADCSVPTRSQNLILKHPHRKVQKLLCWSCKQQQQQNTTGALSSRNRILLTHYVNLRAHS